MSATLVVGLVLACAQPRPSPKTGDVIDESAQLGCVTPGGPNANVPVAPTPVPEPEKPAVVAKPSEAPHREQPSPADQPKPETPAEKSADAAPEKRSPADLRT
ncbi:hypothetical protein BH11MYX1_BH11MYX1_16840 [soil metagenome]